MSSGRSCFSLFILVAAFFFTATHAEAAIYYVHPAVGDDNNYGTNQHAPFRTLSRVNQLKLHAGDQVLLSASQKFEGQLAFENLAGTAASPIVISSYADNSQDRSEQAEIDARGFVAGVCLKNCSFVQVANLKISADGGGMRPDQLVKLDLRCGLLVVADRSGEFVGITLTNLTVKDIFYESPGFVRNPADTKTANGKESYGWGIRFLNAVTNGVIRDVTIVDCQIENVSHTGLQFGGGKNGLINLAVQGIKISHTGGPGVQMSGVSGGRFSFLDVNGSGSTNDTRNWKRGSGLWTWSTRDVVIDKSRFQNANGPGDSCGVHIDYNCQNVIVQQNFSANNAGGFCEILGNNYNCAYRYNVSVNDGYRTKNVNGAFQEGKTFWLSGYVGEKKPQQGPFNTYFYNNTVYLRKDIDAKIAISPTARGVLIANNIFYFQGRSRAVKGDQTHVDSVGLASSDDVVFKNNLFLRRDNWPANLLLRDPHPIIGDPGFKNGGGLNLMDYVPTNLRLIKSGGISISSIPHDAVGLFGGLKVEADILGQRISKIPSLGAIEPFAEIYRSSK